jgi:hypothetical protein
VTDLSFKGAWRTTTLPRGFVAVQHLCFVRYELEELVEGMVKARIAGCVDEADDGERCYCYQVTVDRLDVGNGLAAYELVGRSVSDP